MTPPLSQRVRVMLVDYYIAVRAAVRLLLEAQGHLQVVAEAATCQEALALATQARPHVVLFEPELGVEQAITFVPELEKQVPNARVIVFTGIEDPNIHYQSVQCGAVGVVLKTEPPETLIEAIQRVHAGEAWLDGALMARMLKRSSNAGKPRKLPPVEARAALSSRERQHAVRISIHHEASFSNRLRYGVLMMES